MTILDFIHILYNHTIFLLKKIKINLFYYFLLKKYPNYYILTNFKVLDPLKNNVLFYYNIKNKSKKLIFFNFLNQKILYNSLGILFKLDSLLKKNIRRSLTSLRLLVIYILKSINIYTNIKTCYLLFNSYIEKKYLNNYLNIFFQYNFKICGLIFYRYNSFFRKIKRRIKRRITKRLIKHI